MFLQAQPKGPSSITQSEGDLRSIDNDQFQIEQIQTVILNAARMKLEVFLLEGSCSLGSQALCLSIMGCLLTRVNPFPSDMTTSIRQRLQSIVKESDVETYYSRTNMVINSPIQDHDGSTPDRLISQLPPNPLTKFQDHDWNEDFPLPKEHRISPRDLPLCRPFSDGEKLSPILYSLCMKVTA